MGVEITESSNVNTIPIEEEMFLNWMDINELLESGEELARGCNRAKRFWAEGLSNKKVSAVVLLDSLEDPEDELHAIDGAKSRKRRNLIVHDDESNDEDTNKCKK
ncbi:hypothetical protein RND71_005179 [Anisodus tanguticus]|uniref:Uncharacterized protein n=1 Tax=Anisodus tanguticus TaxID=243964 RepID=A0AAE1SR12_9SOLA|nr:hypothetical protein RND71_005179 [Anisodus tanguticus]